MLLDHHHRKWIYTTLTFSAVALLIYLYFRWTTPEELTGGSTVGLWYGLIGYGLMIYAGLLAVLRKCPSLSCLGKRQTWLRGHIWFGLLSGPVIWCHSGFRWGGLLEVILWIVLLLVFVTGIVGLVLQQILPCQMTKDLPREAPYEQIPYMCEVMRREADALVDRTKADPKLALAAEVKEQLDALYTDKLRPFLATKYNRKARLADPDQLEAVFARSRPLKDFEALGGLLEQLRDLCDQRRQLGEQERLHYWLHVWLLVHAPLSILLFVLGAAHAVMALYY